MYRIRWRLSSPFSPAGTRAHPRRMPAPLRRMKQFLFHPRVSCGIMAHIPRLRRGAGPSVAGRENGQEVWGHEHPGDRQAQRRIHRDRLARDQHAAAGAGADARAPWRRPCARRSTCRAAAARTAAAAGRCCFCSTRRITIFMSASRRALKRSRQPHHYVMLFCQVSAAAARARGADGRAAAPAAGGGDLGAARFLSGGGGALHRRRRAAGARTPLRRRARRIALLLYGFHRRVVPHDAAPALVRVPSASRCWWKRCRSSSCPASAPAGGAPILKTACPFGGVDRAHAQHRAGRLRARARAAARAGRAGRLFLREQRDAFGALRAARELGVPVPERLAIAGFTDSPVATLSEPPLTTISQPIRQLGAVTARMLPRPHRDAAGRGAAAAGDRAAAAPVHPRHVRQPAGAAGRDVKRAVPCGDGFPVGAPRSLPGVLLTRPPAGTDLRRAAAPYGKRRDSPARAGRSGLRASSISGISGSPRYAAGRHGPGFRLLWRRPAPAGKFFCRRARPFAARRALIGRPDEIDLQGGGAERGHAERAEHIAYFRPRIRRDL